MQTYANMTDFEINELQFKRKISISDMLMLKLERPELQRDLNLETVQKIVDYQSKRYSETGSFFFVGDLHVTINVQNGCLYLIDGQHRYYAILQELYKIMPEYIISLNFIKISDIRGDIYPSLEDVFILINKYTPIPKYILDCASSNLINAEGEKCTLSSNSISSKKLELNYYKLIIDQFRTYMKKEYKPYLSEAVRPRDPNISLDKMCDKIMNDSIILFQYIKDGTELFNYMKYINNKIWTKFDPEKKGNKVINKPLYAYVQYILNAENDWTSNIKLIQDFISTMETATTTTETAITAATATTETTATVPDTPVLVESTKRKHIPQKVRQDLWKKYYGENYNALCLICKQQISINIFEAGHIISAADGGGDNIDNLRPICRDCNRSMGTKNMDYYIEKYYS
jgi:hypothetical protein